MKNVVQYISPYCVAKTYRWINLLRNTERKSSAKRNGILSICLRHMLYEFSSPKDLGIRKEGRLFLLFELRCPNLSKPF